MPRKRKWKKEAGVVYKAFAEHPLYVREYDPGFHRERKLLKGLKVSAKEFWEHTPYVGMVSECVQNHMNARKLIEAAKPKPDARVASIACGVGTHELLFSRHYPGFRFDAVDPSVRNITVARQDQKLKKFANTNVRFKQGEFLRPGLEKGKFDLVMSIDAFQYVATYASKQLGAGKYRRWKWFRPGKLRELKRKYCRIALTRMRELLNEKNPNASIILSYTPKCGDVGFHIPAGEMKEMLQELGFQVPVAKHVPFYPLAKPGGKQYEQAIVLARLKPAKHAE